MKKLFLLIFIFTTVLYAETAIVPINKAKEIVDRNATSVEEDVYLPDAIPFSNVEDELIGNSLYDPIGKNSSSNFTVKRGERPPIDLQALPDDAYEKGILKIKLDESFTNQLDNNPVNLGENGAVIFNIAAIDQLNEQYNPTGFKKSFECGAFSPEFTDRHRAWGFHLWYTLYFDDKTDIKELVLSYEQLPEVSIAEPQYRTEMHSTPMPFQSETDKEGSGTPPIETTSNDTHFGLQWHYHNTGQYSGTVDADIDLPEAWDLETGNPNVLVSIHDQGVQYTHPDLNLNFSGLSYDFYNDDPTISFGYHGTHVAGTVTAETNNSIGVAGVAGGWNSEGVNYMSAMVYLPGGGSGNGHHLAPIWAADNGACIEQNSWGYTSAGYYDQAVLDAIDYFNTNGGGSALSGGITIYAAGNSYSEGNYYPGCYSGTFAIAATDNHDVKAPYSTYGTWVDISAPGGDNSVMDERAVYSTWTGSSYGYIDGTSMACPHASGTAGLIISMAYGQLSPTDVADILRNTTDNIDALNPTVIGKIGTGRLNAYQALLETQNYMVTPGTLMPIPAHSSSYTGNVRGYWFTAPTDFIVTGLRVPIDIAGDQTIEIIRFNSGPPPVYSGTTNDFVSLGRWVGVAGSGFITCNIPVSNGDHIGILGCRGTTTSYGSPNNYVTSINGNAVTLVRMGMQHPLTTYVAQDIWQEPSGTAIGRIEMYYESVPGIWTGAVDYWWNHTGNWSDGVIPDASTNVTIPAGTPNDCWVAIGDGFCNNITIESGALLRIYDEILTVSGNMYNHGLLKLEEGTSSGVPGELHVGNDIVWESGSTAQILSNSLNMFISGDWNFESGANVQLTQGYVTFEGSLNSWIRSYDPDCYFSHIRNEKTGTYGLAVSEVSTEDLYINGNIYNYSGNIFRFRSDHSVILDGFFNNMGGHFEGQFGTIVFDGWPGATDLKPNTGDYLNNVTFSTSSPLGLDNTYSNLLTINGDVLIEAGGIDANNFTIEVAGIWANTVGTGGFVEGTSRVRLIKPDAGVQFINSDEHFNILENASVGGFRPGGGSDVSCNVYDWTSGGISTSGSTFTAFDLEDSGIYDDLYAHPNSSITLHQDAGQYVHLLSSVIWIKDNASINIIGGADESYWCTSADLELLIEGTGVFDFDGWGITIFNSYMLTEDITDGSIKTSGWFTCNRTDFNPAGGSFEFYGGTDSRIDLDAGSTFHDLLINKSGGDRSSVQIKDRDDKSNKSSRSNTALLYSDVVVDNKLTIAEGELALNGYELSVANDVDVYGTLNMTNAADILNVGNAAYDNLAFRNGSFGNLTAGVVNLASWVWVDVGGLLTATTGNTMNFIAPSVAGIEVDASGSVFGHINVISATPLRLWSYSSQLIEVDGNFDLQAGNTIDFQNHSMIVHGLFTDDPTSTVYVYDGPVDGRNTKLFSADDNSENQKNFIDHRSRGGSFEIDTDFTLTGLMNVGDGDVLVHGAFELATTGTLIIDGGSFINDESTRDRAWRYLRGTFNLSDGLFEITNNSANFASTATTNISGGTIRTGGAFYGVHAGTFQPTGGIVEIIGGGGDDVVYCSNGNYFYDFVINRNPGIYAALMHETHVQNDLTINSGILSCNFTSDDLYVGGNWINNVGTGGFLPNTNTVIFNGTGDVSITPGETFYNLTLDKVSSADHLDLFGPVTVGNDLTINPGTLYSNDNTISVSGNIAVNSGGVLCMEANSTLEIGDASSLDVFGGGTLEVLGAPGNLATVTHRSTDKYAFNIYSGGTISAEYGLFEHMTANGVYVRDGGFVDPSHSFDYCTFQNGYVGSGTLLYVENDEDLTITGANFPDSSSTFYNVAKIEDHGTITMVNYTGIFSGEVYDYDYYERIDWGGLSAIDDLTIQYNSGTDEIELNWTYPVPVDQFKIYRSTDPYDFSGADVFTVYTESYSEAATGINYFYQVTAEDISDNGGTRGKTGRSDSAPWDK